MDLGSHYSMSDQILTLLNVPAIFFIFTANTFYGFCLVFNRQRLKLLLRILLGNLITCSNLYCVSLILLFTFLKSQKRFVLLEVSWMTVVYSIHNSMTCYVCLIFYYYVHIVPTKRPFLIWTKRNFKYVALVAMAANNGIFSVTGVFFVMDRLHVKMLETIDINYTRTGCDYTRLIVNRTFFFILQVDVFMCILIIIVCSFSTSYYLNRNLRNLTRSGSGSCSVTVSFRSQMRVAITGSLQGLLYILFYIQYLTESFLYNLPSGGSLKVSVSFTITTVYLAITTVNTGLGQAIIRRSAMLVWKALKAWWYGNK